ncbi:CD276 antigen homolog [Scomber scombrus]|uniref:CD276 antigen homolog n=1 Tax=Scomber scombrus TaxID=13677 RepID=UPI002DD8CACD|nr:CD276 antigen homolog [Scomber scombrus]
MLHQMNRPSLQSSLKILSVLVLPLLLTHSCKGQSQLIGPSQPIVATAGDDIILPCQLQPAEDVANMTLEWKSSDLDSRLVYVWRAGQDMTHLKHPSYKERTSLSIDGLKQGNISLKLSKVKLSDGGKYKCHIPKLNKESFVELIVGAVSSSVISLAGTDRDTGTVVLQCESKGWYPQPEVLWLDSEGNLLSAGPTETIRGPDGLYTVSSRVTVEKRLSNNFTCRVQQNNINQIRETYIIVADDFFKVQSSSSPAVIGLAVSLVVCIVVVVAVFFFGWKWRKNMIKTRRSCRDETDGGGNKNLSKSDDPVMQPLNVVDTDGETFIVENKQAECDLLMKLLQLHEENQRRERDLQTLKENLETKIKELETIKAAWFKGSKEKEAEKEKEVATLKKKLQTKQKEFQTKTKEIKVIKDELQQLRDENQRKETDLQRQTEETNNKERPDVSQHNDTNPAGKNSTEVFVEVDPDGKHLRLTTKSKEELKLEGWKLRVTLNDENPNMFTFGKSCNLNAENNVKIWANGRGVDFPPYVLQWKDLKCWTKADKLLIQLINCHGEIVKTTEV